MKKLELFDIGSTKPTVSEVDGDRRLVDLVEISETDVLVLVDDTDDQVELLELDVTKTITELSQGNSILSLLRNPRAKVTVNVTYLGDTVPIHVHAATRLRRVRKLAIEALCLDAERAADTVLRLEDSEDDLPLKRPIGAYINQGQH
jgi:hypothetical protein